MTTSIQMRHPEATRDLGWCRAHPNLQNRSFRLARPENSQNLTPRLCNRIGNPIPTA